MEPAKRAKRAARARVTLRRPRGPCRTLCGSPCEIGDDRLYASIEQPVLITRCAFHMLPAAYVAGVEPWPAGDREYVIRAA
jgi:hypothetical protein